MEETNLFAFYGSLRRGMSNNMTYESVLKYISTKRIPGYCLYALSEYPYAVQSEVKTDSIVIELFSVINEKAKRDIHQLELGAGYFFDVIEIESQKVGIYLFENVGNNPKVNNGDWVEFFGKEASI